MKRIIAVMLLLFICLYSVSSKSETSPDSTVLQNVIKEFFITENERLLEKSSISAKAQSNTVVSLKGIAIKKAKARKSIKDMGRKANEIVGIKFTTVTTEIKIVKITSLKDKNYIADVIETTSYGYDDNTPPYEYSALHQVTFEQQMTDDLVITNIKSLDPMSDVRDEQILPKMKGISAKSAEKSFSVITDMKLAIDRNLPVLLTQDQMKQEGRSIISSSKRIAMRDLIAKNPIPKTNVARPKTKPLVNLTTRTTDGGGYPYSYSAMVNWALKYAKDTPVTYARDTNDCTNFVSWALWKGGWAEAGSETYLNAIWNRDEIDVWYWRCSTCSPKHSYTWGGAANWQNFAYYSGRVFLLSYMTDLNYADVAQIEIDNYGSLTGPDHTMMVTGRSSTGVALLSYHSSDTKNKPLNLIIQQNNGPYWGYNT